MKIFYSFCKKEALESLRTYRFIIMLAAFALFGIMSPFLAKMLPDLVNSSLGNESAFQLPEATAMDAWGQFFKNIGQMGVLVLAIVFCGITATELGKGTLVNILTKGMRRSTVILSKLTVSAIIWTVSYCFSLGINTIYIVYFWGNVQVSNAFLALVSPWVFGLLLITLMILGGICFKNILGSLLFAAGAIIIMSLLNIAPSIQKYNPISLSGGSVNLLSGQSVPGDIVPALAVCLALMIIGISASILVFNRKQV